MPKPHGYWNEFGNLETELLTFIEEHGVPGAMPTRDNLKQAGRGDLGTAIEKHGGSQSVAKQLGLTYAKKRNGYWNEFSNLEQELRAFIEECGIPGVMPTAEELQKASRSSIVAAVCKHGGFQLVAERLGLEFINTAKPPAYWEDFTNLKSELYKFMNLYSNSGVMPTQNELRKSGNSGLARAIEQHGGWKDVAQKLGLNHELKSHRYWYEFDNLKIEISHFIEEHGTRGVMPTSEELRQAGRGKIENAIYKHGGQQVVAERLGLTCAKKSKGYWDDFENIKSEIIAFNEGNETSGAMPTREKLNKAGKGDLAAAISDKHGGYQSVAEKLDLTYAKKRNGYWKDFGKIERAILEFIKKHGTPGVMPAHEDLKKARLGGLCDAIQMHGGYQLVAERLGLELSYTKWTVQAIRRFVGSLMSHLETFTSAEFYLLFQQSGLLHTYGKGKSFVNALATGRFPAEELEKFVNGQPSIVDKFLQDKQLTLEALETSGNNDIPDKGDVTSEDNLDDQIDETVEPSEEEDDLNLPVVQTREVLASLDHSVVSSADEEAVKFLIASAKAKIWKHVFRDETAAVTQAQNYTGDSYAEKVKTEFLDEYHQAKNLPIPTGYNFRINGKLAEPNLMQRLAAVQVRDKKRVGNWSGTGAGKTLSAVLASRVINAHLTVICCPNSVVEGWEKAILDIFPDSVVVKKTFTPDWKKAPRLDPPQPPLKRGEKEEATSLTSWVQPDVANTSLLSDEDSRNFQLGINSPQKAPLFKGGWGDLNSRNQPENPQYLILNYEMFQQPNSANWVRTLINNQQIDFIVIDEIHYTKQRQVEDISKRKQLVSALTTAAAERNPDLHIIGMSATPVINNLQEGKSLVELITGVAHNELDIRPTLPNCMRLHQRLVTLGIRWMPEYNLSYEQLEIRVDCEEFIEDIRALGRNGTPLELEKILTRARLPIIRSHIQPKTLIYTHYIQGIDKLLRDALIEDGWNVGFYTGEDKSGLEGFLKGNVDVLIGSSAIGTGVDGLQQVCNQLIINVLPWTHAEFEQLKGRIYRQGQRQDKVTLIIPLTYADVNGQRWSWCDSKMQRLRFKKSIADAAVDGIVPEGHLRTPVQAYQDIMAWLERLETGQVETITRPKIIIPLPEDDPTDVQRRQHRYGDFSTLNRLWNQSRSDTTHQHLQANPEEWAQYHTLYQESRKQWSVVPYEEMIRWCQQRSGYAIADFGCGEAKLAEAVSDRHTVYSFDHIAINNNVVACDMAHVPLNDEELDVAIFSLSLMGSNFTDYLREAYRTLKLDGELHIIEATSRFSNLSQFQTDLEALGFDIVRVRDMWKFTHIRALKTERKPQEKIELRF
jgi:superfamily II DNA or RNA helicase